MILLAAVHLAVVGQLVVLHVPVGELDGFLGERGRVIRNFVLEGAVSSPIAGRLGALGDFQGRPVNVGVGNLGEQVVNHVDPGFPLVVRLHHKPGGLPNIGVDEHFVLGA
ncbi:hypothetical protein SDC9_196657 [bioreactor metagenome]|uniref:Uncharacterized protein n=1 Tax=bioreactor metagenome TaxID=1076179 RepID=A0A645IL50_9ZZZZ